MIVDCNLLRNLYLYPHPQGISYCCVTRIQYFCKTAGRLFVSCYSTVSDETEKLKD